MCIRVHPWLILPPICEILAILRVLIEWPRMDTDAHGSESDVTEAVIGSAFEVVEEKVIVELKCVECFAAEHLAQANPVWLFRGHYTSDAHVARRPGEFAAAATRLEADLLSGHYGIASMAGTRSPVRRSTPQRAFSTAYCAS